MMRSLYSGVSGLKNHQTRMDVIGNNIANVNTNGYKASRVVFQDVYSQMSKSASAPNGMVVGGTNPMQIGLGVTLSAIDIIHTNAAPARTDRELDLAIEGDGFFIVNTPGNQLMYTRVGNLYLDEKGNLLNSTGNFVMGHQSTTTYLVKKSVDAVPPSIDNPAGVPYQPSEFVLVDPDADPDDRELINPLDPASDGFDDYFNADGTLKDEYAETYEIVTGLNPFYLTVLDSTAPFGPENVSTTLQAGIMQNGLTNINIAGYKNITIDEGGVVRGLDANGNQCTIAILGIATFANTGGLEKKGNNLYAQSANTGNPVFGQSQVGTAGRICPGALEMSNVDLANEFTDMIITQRGFQANSRIITTSDSLLEELVNLKR